MYRSLCIFLLIAFSASAFGLSEDDVFIERKCRTKHKISEHFARSAQDEPASAWENPEARCYLACLLTGIDMLNPDGTLNVEMTHKTLIFSDKVLGACAHKKGKDACETAYETILCINRPEETIVQ